MGVDWHTCGIGEKATKKVSDKERRAVKCSWGRDMGGRRQVEGERGY